MESTSTASGVNNHHHHHHHPRLPPGFRFHPTDEELVVHYLKKRAASAPLPAAIIADLDLYKYDPWELPSKASFGEQEWYFFSRRERKYPNGERPNRSATSGYWKATGTDKPVVTANGTQTVGVKKALVFYGGKAPKGTKTNWIMHEYRLANANSTTRKLPPGFGNKNPSRLDDWVLCRIFKKSKEEENMHPIIPMATQSISVHGGYDNQSSVMPAGDPMSMPSPMANSRPELVENVFSAQYNWINGNGKSIRWGDGQEEDDSCRNTRDDDGGVSFISLLNQQFPQTLMQQHHPHHNSPGEGHGILDPSSQFPTTSYFH